MRRPRVLITGGSGYVGSLVAKGLATDGRSTGVIVAADVRPPRAPIEGVTHLTWDVRDDGLQAILLRHEIDTVVHLAAIVSPQGESSRAMEYAVDVEGTKNVLEACVAAGVGKLIITSSGAAYGYHADNDPLLTEDSPIRGNEEFAYACHKRLVEQMLERYRREHPQLEQLVFRPGTILGRTVANQITAMFSKPFVLGLADAATPFVFIWDEDVVAIIVEGVFGAQTGIYNLAGDGVMTLREIARALNKPFVPIPSRWLERCLGALKRFDFTRDLVRYGPEQVRFLQYRPVLSNERLKHQFGYRPRRTTREVFDLYVQSHA